jgi:hypothetical protein
MGRPGAAVIGGDLLLAVFDDQVGLHVHVSLATRRRWAQAALVELFAHRLADALFGEVALDAWVIRAVLQGRVFPGPAAVGAEIPAGVKIVVDLAGLATAQQHCNCKRSDTTKHDCSPKSEPH